MSHPSETTKSTSFFKRVRRSLSAQLLGLTVVFVLLAEVVVLIPSIAKQRHDWLSARTEAAYLVGLALEAPDAEMIDRQVASQLFATANILGVMVNRNGASIQVYAPELDAENPRPMHFIDLRNKDALSMVGNAWATIFSSGDDVVRVVGEPAFANGETVDILVSQRALRSDLHIYMWNILGLSLVISTLTATLVYWTLNRMIVKPVRNLTRNMAAFNTNPDDARTIIKPGRREDEIGDAQQGLFALERRLHDLLSQRARLAALGAGVSKISHDLRNILASAQLMSDRLAKSDDPRVRRLSPRLIQSLDRAIALSRDTLSYARMEPSSLAVTRFELYPLVEEVFDDAASQSVDFLNETPPEFLVAADRTQLYRALFNLVRNAVEAFTAAAISEGDEATKTIIRPKVTIRARSQCADTIIDVIDNGPGIPDSAREHLFEPFKGSLKPGGSGLGGAIAYEIVRAHRGELRLGETGDRGSRLELTLPQT